MEHRPDVQKPESSQASEDPPTKEKEASDLVSGQEGWKQTVLQKVTRILKLLDQKSKT